MALKWLTNVAKQGHIKAQYLLTLVTQKQAFETSLQSQQVAEPGVFKTPDFINLINQHLNELIEKEKNQACYLFGLMYYEGQKLEKNIHKALILLEQLAEQELSETRNLISKIKKEYEQFDLNELLIRAETGEAQAQYLLGLKYYQGEEVGKNINLALEWFYQAALQGVVEAQNLVFIIQNQAKLSKKAQEGNAQAQYLLGLMYYEGKEVEKDLQTALHWVKCAEKQGLLEAQALIVEIEKEYEQLSLDELLIQVETGDERIYYFLGLKYYQGLEVRKDFDIALKYFSQAAALGLVEAQNRISAIETERDKQLPLTELLMKANHGEARAKYLLGLRYYEDEEKDIYTALEWFEQAAQQNVSQAQYMISLIEEEYEQLPLKALFAQAEIGDKQAQYLLGLKYYQGTKIKKNLDQALKWLYQAAEQGVIKAQELIILIDREQEFYPDLFDKAVEKAIRMERESFPSHQNIVADFRDKKDQDRYYERRFQQGMTLYRAGQFAKVLPYISDAARQGFASAQFRLAHMYTHGEGVPIDVEQSEHWLRQARGD